MHLKVVGAVLLKKIYDSAEGLKSLTYGWLPLESFFSFVYKNEDPYPYLGPSQHERES